MCLRDAESASTCKASPTCGPQPGVVLTFGSYFWMNLWITITLSIPDGYPLPLENHIVSVSAPITTNGTEATSYHCQTGCVERCGVRPCVPFHCHTLCVHRTFALFSCGQAGAGLRGVYSCALCESASQAHFLCYLSISISIYMYIYRYI